MTDFKPFPKTARISREVIITEKLDGTNASIYIGDDGEFLVGSRTRWITPENDNYGFAKWAYSNRDELLKLGSGLHFGEWWGQGIQRNYGMTEKRFSLFNVSRWNEENPPPNCCHIVPHLATGALSDKLVDGMMDFLKVRGSQAVPYMNPEGIVIFHTQNGVMFKKTFEDAHKEKKIT